LLIQLGVLPNLQHNYWNAELAELTTAFKRGSKLSYSNVNGHFASDLNVLNAYAL